MQQQQHHYPRGTCREQGEAEFKVSLNTKNY